MEKCQDIKIDMEAVKRIIDEIGADHKEFSTIDVIKKIFGKLQK